MGNTVFPKTEGRVNFGLSFENLPEESVTTFEKGFEQNRVFIYATQFVYNVSLSTTFHQSQKHVTHTSLWM